MQSRYCAEAYPVPKDHSPEAFWKELLIDAPQQVDLDGHLIFACNDDAVEFLANHREALKEHYLLDIFVPDLQLAMLDKLETLKLADQKGFTRPRSWEIRSLEDLEKIKDEISYPVIVKPVFSHLFLKKLGKKLFLIESGLEELSEKVRLSISNDLPIIIAEYIPGPDTCLQSYSTYIDSEGKPLYRFTKRVIRRYPVGFGSGCFHRSEWFPDVAALGQKFLEDIGYRGPATIEFKRDKDLKLIEVNARFSAPHELALRCGVPMDLIAYCYLTSQKVPELNSSFKENIALISPLVDFCAYLELRGKGQLSLGRWISSLFETRFYVPVFSWSDPIPFFFSFWVHIKRTIRGA
jgi:predicted ATP-grasp superfamily ATP-dependent carboligase